MSKLGKINIQKVAKGLLKYCSDSESAELNKAVFRDRGASYFFITEFVEKVRQRREGEQDEETISGLFVEKREDKNG